MVVVHFKLTHEILNLYDFCDLFREYIVGCGMDTSRFDESLNHSTLVKDFKRVFLALKALDRGTINRYLNSQRMLSYTV